MDTGPVAAAAKSLQSCPTLCNPTDSSPPGSSIPGILQARILEWVAISFSNAYMHAKLLQLCLTFCDLLDYSPGKEMATHSSILAWRILWTEEPGGLLSIGSHRVGHD